MGGESERIALPAWSTRSRTPVPQDPILEHGVDRIRIEGCFLAYRSEVLAGWRQPGPPAGPASIRARESDSGGADLDGRRAEGRLMAKQRPTRRQVEVEIIWVPVLEGSAPAP